MEFICNRCEIPKPFTTLRGWKQHMSRSHGGYSASDIAAATAEAGGEVSEDNVAARMQQFARTLSGNQGAEPDGSVSGEGDAAPSPPTQPPAPPVKTVKATPKKLRKILGAIPTKLLESTGIELDDEDKEAMDEAGEFMTDIFGFEFEVPQEKKVLHNRAWAIVWVFGVAAMIYFKHHFAELWQKLSEEYKKNKEKEKEEAVLVQ